MIKQQAMNESRLIPSQGNHNRHKNGISVEKRKYLIRNNFISFFYLLFCPLIFYYVRCVQTKRTLSKQSFFVKMRRFSVDKSKNMRSFDCLRLLRKDVIK